MKAQHLPSTSQVGAGESGLKLGQFRAALLRRGFPPAYVERIVTELGEHWQDLRDETLADESLDAATAAVTATGRLGSLDDVAAELTKRLRSASWWGRHRFTTFGVFPLLMLFVWWVVLLLLGIWTSGAPALGSPPSPMTLSEWVVLNKWILAAQLGGYLCVPWIFCRLAQRSFAGFAWGLTACAVIAFHNLVHFIQFIPPDGTQHARFTWGYGIRSDLSGLNLGGFVVPLLVFAWFQLRAFNARRHSHT